MAEAGEPARLAILATRQTHARGSRGRTWATLPGNLALSILLRPTGPATDAGHWALLAAVALAEAIDATPTPSLRAAVWRRSNPGATGAHVAPGLLRQAARNDGCGLSLKWPNDLLLDGRKLAGILIDSALRPDHSLDWLVIGFGANLAAAPPNAVALPTPVDPAALTPTLLDRIDAWDKTRLTEGFAPIRQAWLARGPAPGTHLQLTINQQTIAGTFQGLSDTGALLLQSGGRVRAFPTGETLQAEA